MGVVPSQVFEPGPQLSAVISSQWEGVNLGERDAQDIFSPTARGAAPQASRDWGVSSGREGRGTAAGEVEVDWAMRRPDM